MRLKAHEEQQQFLPRQSGTYHATKLYTVFHSKSYFRNFVFNLKAGCYLPFCSDSLPHLSGSTALWLQTTHLNFVIRL